MSTDRLATGYEPDFDIDYEVGKQGELYSYRIVESLQAGGRIEVKTDEKAAETGNVFVEYQCKYRGEWKLTGILNPDGPEMWCFVIGEAAVFAQADRLRDICKYYAQFPAHRGECKVGSHPTRGIVVPIRNLIMMIAYGPPKMDQTRMDTP